MLDLWIRAMVAFLRLGGWLVVEDGRLVPGDDPVAFVEDSVDLKRFFKFGQHVAAFALLLLFEGRHRREPHSVVSLSLGSLMLSCRPGGFPLLDLRREGIDEDLREEATEVCQRVLGDLLIVNAIGLVELTRDSGGLRVHGSAFLQSALALAYGALAGDPDERSAPA